jgi:hypothetical protein
VFDVSGAPYGPESSSTLASMPALRETLVAVIAAAENRVGRSMRGPREDDQQR